MKDQKEFIHLIRQLEEVAERNPSGYRIQVGMLAFLGYAYVALVVLGLVTLLIGLLWVLTHVSGSGFLMIKFGWAIVGLLAVTVAAFWVTIPAPLGKEVSPDEAPELFSTIDDVGERLAARTPHHVLLTDDFNAAIVQVPRMGIFGWHDNYLILGVPLMQALSPEQFRVVLAHEFGHLSANHGRFAGWIYRVRQGWSRLLEEFESTQRWGAGLFRSFLEWYAPYFAAYSFVLARTSEYEADRCALLVGGADDTARTLVRVQAIGRHYEVGCLQRLWARSDREPDPPSAPFTDVCDYLADGPPPARHGELVAAVLAEETEYADTHPALKDRLGALGLEASEVVTSAALRTPAPSSFALLGDDLKDRVQSGMDAAWRQRIAGEWRENHREKAERRQAFEALRGRAANESLSVEDRWALAMGLLEFEGADAALPLLRDIMDASPDHLPARFIAGRILLEKNDPEGVAMVEEVMARDLGAVLPGCQVLHAYHVARGDEAAARACVERAEHHQLQIGAAKAERESLGIDDPFEPHGLPAEAVGAIATKLATLDPLQEAYLVRKSVEHLPNHPLFVLGLVPRHTGRNRYPGEEAELLSDVERDVDLPGMAHVMLLVDGLKPFRRVLRGVPDSLVYQREPDSA